MHSTCCALEALGHDQHISPKCLKKGLSLSRLEGRSPQVIFFVDLRGSFVPFVDLLFHFLGYWPYLQPTCRQFLSNLLSLRIEKKLLLPLDWLGKWLHAGHWGSESRRVRTWPFSCRPVQHFKVLYVFLQSFRGISSRCAKFCHLKDEGSFRAHMFHKMFGTCPAAVRSSNKTRTVSRHQVCFILHKWHLRWSYRNWN